MFDFLKKKTPEEKQAKFIDKNIAKIANEGEKQKTFSDFECSVHFRGREKAAQNEVKLDKWRCETCQLKEDTCRFIEQTPKSALSDVAIDFYERHVFWKEQKWKE